MAVYAPKTTGRADQTKVASLVEPNPAGAADPEAEGVERLLTLDVEGKRYGVVGDVLAGPDGTVPYMGRPSGQRWTPETVLRQDLYVCENQADYDRSVLRQFSMKEVFENWDRGGRVGAYSYGETQQYPVQARGLAALLKYNLDNGLAPSAWEQLQTETPTGSWHYPSPDADWGCDESLGPKPVAGPMGYAFWYYSERLSSIVQPANTYDTSYFKSTQQYSTYDVTFMCRSFSGDDDYNGFVAAATKPAAPGQPGHILVVSRSCNRENGVAEIMNHFCVQVDSAWASWTSVDKGRWCSELSAQTVRIPSILSARFFNTGRSDNSDPDTVGTSAWWAQHPYKWEQDQIDANRLPADRLSTYVNDPTLWGPLEARADGDRFVKSYGWAGAGVCYVRVRRIDDRLTAWTTPMSRASTEYEQGDFGGPGENRAAEVQGWTDDQWNRQPRIVIDMGDEAANPDLQQFRGPQQVGFFSMSQPWSVYKVLDFKLPKVIVRTDTYQVIKIDPVWNSTTVLPDLPADYCGRGRLCRNPATGKTFYVGNQQLVKVSGGNAETWQFTVKNGADGPVSKDVLLDT